MSHCDGLWFCPVAIGALEWDKNWRRHYFPEGDAHIDARGMTGRELVQAGAVWVPRYEIIRRRSDAKLRRIA